MGIEYRDFFPTVVKEGFLTREYEELTATVARANEWVSSTQVRVINVETVVLPNVANAEYTRKTSIRTSGEMSSYWFQVVRVWYEAQIADRTS